MAKHLQNPQPDQPTLHIENPQQPDEIKVSNPPNSQPDQPTQHLK